MHCERDLVLGGVCERIPVKPSTVRSGHSQVSPRVAGDSRQSSVRHLAEEFAGFQQHGMGRATRPFIAQLPFQFLAAASQFAAPLRHRQIAFHPHQERVLRVNLGGERFNVRRFRKRRCRKRGCRKRGFAERCFGRRCAEGARRAGDGTGGLHAQFPELPFDRSRIEVHRVDGAGVKFGPILFGCR